MLCLFLFAVLAAAQPARLLEIMSSELDRNFKALKEKGDPAPYYLSYTITEQQIDSASASLGTLTSSVERHSRSLDVTIRVGTPKLDNYHTLRGEVARFTSGTLVSLDDNPNAIKLKLWQETDRCYRLAAQRLVNIRTNKEVKVAEKEASDDFSAEPPATFNDIPSHAKYDEKAWTGRLRKLSAGFSGQRHVLNSSVAVFTGRELKYMVSTEGSRLAHGRPFSRIMISASGKAQDGMDLAVFDAFSAGDPKDLPADKQVNETIARMSAELKGLLDAPLVEPFVGPAILSGRAAGVFFHEIFGHRIEGHRLKDEGDGQTFAKSVGSSVLPDFLSVTFDPTLRRAAGEELNGWYHYDDEGIQARKVTVVDKGILKTFLMCRTPIPAFGNSNGHGRREPGAEVVSRQSNLLVEAAKTVSDARLKELLIEEVKKQNKPYGLFFQDITGGFTNTDRRSINAFKVIPLVVYRIYPDGREELVRGADIVGTPLASFAKILAAGDKLDVFNGYCGAESGSVPVSAVAPRLLISEIEIQKKDSSRERPPLLTPPPASDGGAR